MKNDRDVELLARTPLYEGHFRMRRYSLRHRLFEGGWSEPIDREVFERGPAVAVLPYDPARDTVVLIEQFRAGAYAAGRPAWLIEAIAGMVEPGEQPEEVAGREAKEEAKLEFTGPLTFVCGHFTSPGACDEYTDVFVGPCDSSKVGGVHGLDNENEDIRVLVLPRETALAMIADRRIQGGPAVMGLYWLQANRDRMRGHLAAPGPAR